MEETKQNKKGRKQLTLRVSEELYGQIKTEFESCREYTNDSTMTMNDFLVELISSVVNVEVKQEKELTFWEKAKRFLSWFCFCNKEEN